MDPTLRFFALLLATVAVLIATVITGLKRRRGLHFACVGTAVALLAGSIWAARLLGDHYDLESAGWITPLHLGLAKLTTALYLLPLLTGVLTLRNPVHRPRHRLAAFLVLGLTLLTTATGAWMLLAARPLP
jgi:hypothetical protein